MSDGAGAPIRIGLLFDFDQGDGGAYYSGGFRLGLEDVDAEGRLGRDIELLIGQADGLPGGSAESVVAEVDAMVAAGRGGDRRTHGQRQRDRGARSRGRHRGAVRELHRRGHHPQ